MASSAKKEKCSSPPSVGDSNSYDSFVIKPFFVYSYYSSVQSKPCLSKTSKGYTNKKSGMGQKSITFCETNANVDWDFHPYGENCLHIMEGFDQMEKM